MHREEEQEEGKWLCQTHFWITQSGGNKYTKQGNKNAFLTLNNSILLLPTEKKLKSLWYVKKQNHKFNMIVSLRDTINRD